MNTPQNFPCGLCEAPVPDTGHVGETACPQCGAVYAYDEGLMLREAWVRQEIGRLRAERDKYEAEADRLRDQLEWMKERDQMRTE